MSERKLLGTMVSIQDYIKACKFLETYNKREGKDLTMSKFIWGCIKFFISHYVKQQKEG